MEVGAVRIWDNYTVHRVSHKSKLLTVFCRSDIRDNHTDHVPGRSNWSDDVRPVHFDLLHRFLQRMHPLSQHVSIYVLTFIRNILNIFYLKKYYYLQ